ncbi:related to CCC1 - Proposed vacuolar iron transport protein [Melanopsichium pennsylvanicum]|uniref:Related to CCC1 - Proposed vacuolar iron transport protein n=2 Tax=Melanopsichium pennsylvanicum TaxID=63383 RepID=A0AAJ5C5I3_9BASI|nr:related to CCC1-Proposed vacuolar iron transport protein [Melanopsichium pennsylvanicum 4]SNX84598.1 related to CCC1 - Proposed vacuolar iron transport protein [Melanopsichium pennsylvanicum]
MACSSKNTSGACANCACAAASSSSSKGASIKLPKSNKTESTPLLWSTTSAVDANKPDYKATTQNSNGAAASSTTTALGPNHECPSSGAQHHDSTFVCCRDVVSGDERTLIDPDFARDCIVGLSDGLTVPFALTAGLSSTGSTKLVVLAGLAELVSGAISMGIGGFLSAQAELSHFAFNQNLTQQRVQRSCASEVQRQVHDILKGYGIASDTSAQIAAELTAKENARREANQKNFNPTCSRRKIFGCIPLPSSTFSSSGSSRQVHRRTVGDEESQESLKEDDLENVGLTPFLLKLGEGLEPVSTSRLYISALTIGLSYFMGGIIPLFPYMFVNNASRALLFSVVITGVILLIFGVVKQRVTGGEGGFKGYAYGAISTLAVGGVAAGASWLLVGLLEGGSDAGHL